MAEERGLMMVVHAALIGLLAYVCMIMLLGQEQSMAENRSVIVGAAAAIYMVMFGHKLPTSHGRA